MSYQRPRCPRCPRYVRQKVDSNKTVFGLASSRYIGRASIDKQASTILQSNCPSPVNKGLSDFNVNLVPVHVRHIVVVPFLFGPCALSSTILTFVAQGSGSVGRDAELSRGKGAGYICHGQLFVEGIVFRQMCHGSTPPIECTASLCVFVLRVFSRQIGVYRCRGIAASV